eukprot:TRINITY_DN5604_c0_g1_i2.p1 TRINITY_DN5604_c0_g1~~TRINITY_DN5604_c0_g1_i2.p1  ORF type:complete len:312 (+),score=22.72 TRINITY_DN5604_c0_g1_i2:104-1039(+)
MAEGYVDPNNHDDANVVKVPHDGHSGHEKLHDTLVLISLAFMIISQIALYFWKQKSPRSFRRVTFIGLWAIPLLISMYLFFWRFLIFWALYSTGAVLMINQARKKPIAKDVPRRVYMFFFIIYRLTYAISVVGYVFLVGEFMGFSQVIGAVIGDQTFHLGSYAITLLFYGLYFGVLNRDCAEIVTERMASTMGFAGKGKDSNMPMTRFDPRTCLLCQHELKPDVEKTFAVPGCDHTFHEFCIRGWSIVGKKDTCPYCGEKVALKASFKNPWESQTVLWGQLLDAVRYLVVWNPVILFGTDLLFRIADKPHA